MLAVSQLSQTDLLRRVDLILKNVRPGLVLGEKQSVHIHLSPSDLRCLQLNSSRLAYRRLPGA